MARNSIYWFVERTTLRMNNGPADRPEARDQIGTGKDLLVGLSTSIATSSAAARRGPDSHRRGAGRRSNSACRRNFRRHQTKRLQVFRESTRTPSRRPRGDGSRTSRCSRPVGGERLERPALEIADHDDCDHRVSRGLGPRGVEVALSGRTGSGDPSARSRYRRQVHRSSPAAADGDYGS